MALESAKNHLLSRRKINIFFKGHKHLFMPLYFDFTMFNKSLHTVHFFLVQILKYKQ